MNILLVSPRTPETFWSFKHALRFVGKRAAGPPLGLITVAAMMPPTWRYRLVDQNTAKLSDEEILWADAVMISAMLVHRKSVVETAGRCKALGRPLLAGGPLFGSELGDVEDVEHVAHGEAEEIIDEIVADLGAGSLKPLYRAPRFPELARSPVPRFDLLQMDHYATMSLQSTRGCPYDCEFCDIVALNGRRPRMKSPGQVTCELDALHRLGWRSSVFFVDDNFIGNRPRCKELLRAIIDWRENTRSSMTFLTEASVDMAEDAALLELMVGAGFKKVFLGIETPAAEGLKECRKLHNLRGDLLTSVGRIQAAGLEVMGGFIVGFDSDTRDIFDRQFDFIQKAGVVTAMVGLLQAVPRSRLYQRLRREGRLRGDSDGDNTSATLNFETRLNRDFLAGKYRDLMRRLYEPGAYYARIARFLDQHRPRGPRAHFSRAELGAFFKSLWLMGVRHRGQRAYWRFLARTLLHHPGQLGLAMTLAVYGHHFRQVAAAL